MQDSCPTIFKDITIDFLSKVRIQCTRYDSEFKNETKKEILASNYEQLSQELFPFNNFYSQYLFFLFLNEGKNPNIYFLDVFKKWLNHCWHYALEKRKGVLISRTPTPIDPKHDEKMKEFFSIRSFARHLMDYSYKILSESNWNDYDILTDESEGELTYGKKGFSDTELAIFSFVSEDFFNAIKESNHFHKGSTSISILEILESPLPSRIDSEKVTYNDKNAVIYTNNISKEISHLPEIDIQHSLDESISRNDSENIKSER